MKVKNTGHNDRKFSYATKSLGCYCIILLLCINHHNVCYGWLSSSKITTIDGLVKNRLLGLSIPCSTTKFGRHQHHHPTATTTTTSRKKNQMIKTSNSQLNYYGDNSDDKISEQTMGLNELHTKLRDAVQREDYVEAGRISDIVLSKLEDTNTNTMTVDEKRARRKRMSWRGLGAAPWLIDRLDSLQYTFPTTIQINAMEAVNAILNDDDDDNTMIASYSQSSTSLEERISKQQSQNLDMGIVISGTTGSGKTLAFLVPLLSTLTDSLFVRQRLRISDEEAVGDTAGDLVDRISVVTSPTINSRNRIQRTNSDTIAIGASMGRSGKDVKSPLALIVIPTRELGIQTALLLYQLIGGNIKNSPTEIVSSKANSFRYKGPKGIRIGCVLDDEEAEFGLKLQTDIAITTPQYLHKLLNDGDIDPNKLRVIVYDEADLALEQTNANDLVTLFEDTLDSNDDYDEEKESKREYTRLTFLVGASVTEALGNLAVSSRILPPGKSYIATATRFAPLRDTTGSSNTIKTTPTTPLGDEDVAKTQSKDDTKQIIVERTQSASLKDLNVCLYPDLKHERVIVKNETGLLVLTRLLRKELQEYEKRVTDNAGQQQIQRPRVVVFFPDEEQAKKAISPLRDALWGEHRLCVLLPKIGVNPLTIMDQFKRNETSVMLATPNSVRGLDFPALTHVYTLYLPTDTDPREYVHLAGRVGRVGQMGMSSGIGGHVVSILKEEEASKMDELAQILGFQYTDIPAPTSDTRIRVNEDGELVGEDEDDQIEIEKMRRLLEDTITLLNVAEEPSIDHNDKNTEDDGNSSDDVVVQKDNSDPFQ